jgi:hypothetical protein
MGEKFQRTQLPKSSDFIRGRIPPNETIRSEDRVPDIHDELVIGEEGFTVQCTNMPVNQEQVSW